jgi:hypothetical protein
MDARAENPRTRWIGARASVLRAVMASTAVRVIPSAHNRLLILVPTLASIEGEARIMVDAEASPNGGVHGTTSPTRGLVDGHVLDTPHRKGVLAGVGSMLLRYRALCLLSCYALKECMQLVVGATRLRRHRFLESLE